MGLRKIALEMYLKKLLEDTSTSDQSEPSFRLHCHFIQNDLLNTVSI